MKDLLDKEHDFWMFSKTAQTSDGRTARNGTAWTEREQMATELRVLLCQSSIYLWVRVY